MKKIFGIILLGMTLFITGCDNNEGPFTTKLESGHKVVYSNNKPAKGWINNTIYDWNGNEVVVYEMYLDKGIPAGDFKLYDQKGNLVVDAKGKWESNLFKGKIKEPKVNGIAQGTFGINKDFLISYTGTDADNFSYETLMDGELESNLYKVSKKNNKFYGKYLSYYNDGTIRAEKYYEDGVLLKETIYEAQGKADITYYKNKNLKSKVITNNEGIIVESMNFDENRERHGEYISRNEDGSLRQLICYEHGKIIGDIYIDDYKSYYAKNGIYKNENLNEIRKKYKM